jgi:hypothetical protein
MDEIKATCCCGNVELSFSLPVTKVVQCHCESCRKMNGSDYSTWIAINNDQFSVDDGNEYIKEFRLNNLSSKSFCSTCGTGVFGINGKHFKDQKLVPLGIVSNYTYEIKPQVQVYTDNRAAWVELHGCVPIFPVKRI